MDTGTTWSRRRCPAGRPAHGFRLWFMAATLALAVSAPAAGAEPLITVPNGGVGIGGYMREGRWAPLVVRLSGGSSDMEGFVETFPIEYRNPGSWNSIPGPLYRRRIVAAKGSTKLFHLYFRYSSYASGVGVRLLNSRKVKVAQIAVPLTALPSEQGWICALSQADRNLVNMLVNSANFPGSRPNIVNFDIASLPPPDQWYGYHGADAVVLHTAGLDSLATPCRQALRDWVRAGGHLIVFFNGNPATYQGAAAREWLPVRVAGTRTLKGFPGLDAVPRFRTSDRLAELGGVVAETTPVPGATVVHLERAPDGDVPLVVTALEGAGRITFVAVDAANRPFRGWAGLGAFTESLLAMGLRPRPLLDEDYQLRNHLGQVPGSSMPSFGVIGVFLAVYILLVAPVNYLVLRRIGRKEWSLFTIPALVVIFSAGAYFVARSLAGGDLWVTRFAFLELGADQGSGLATTAVHVLSPANRDYVVSSREPGAWSLLQGSERPETAVFDLTPPGRVEELSLSMWERRFLRFEHIYTGGGVNCALVRQGNRITGSITNNGSFDLGTVVLWLPDSRMAVLTSSLGPGQAASVSMLAEAGGDFRQAFSLVGAFWPTDSRRLTPPSTPGSGAFGSLAGLSAASDAKPAQRCLVLARLNSIPWNVEISGFSPRARDEGVAVILVDVPATWPVGRTGSVEGAFVTYTNASVSDDRVYLSANGSVEFEFELKPETVARGVKSLSLITGTSTPGSRDRYRMTNAAVSGFHWEQRRWVDWPISGNLATTTSPGPFIDRQSNRVHVRLTGSGTFGYRPLLEYTLEK